MDKMGVGHASVTGLEKKYVMDALENGRLSQGKYVTAFEKGFAHAHGQKYGVMCSSGTAALQMALAALKETDGWDGNTEVLCPAVTFIATPNACLHTGLKVKFVDVEPDTYNMDPGGIEKHITPHTRCIIPVHTFGLPCKMAEIMEIAKKHNLRVIEDCAEAHFAETDGRTVGSFGDISAYSTYVAHTITTGIGGITCTNNREFMEILRSLAAHGRACTCEQCVASGSKSVCPKRMETGIDRRFCFERLGYSFRAGEIEGALGLAQLERREEIMGKRHGNARYLIEKLEKYEDMVQLPRHPDNTSHTYMMFPLVVKKDSGLDKNKFVKYLESCNIETRPMLPLLNQPVYLKMFGNLEPEYPVAAYINHNGFYTGCHHGLGMEELDYMASCIGRFIEKEGRRNG